MDERSGKPRLTLGRLMVLTLLAGLVLGLLARSLRAGQPLEPLEFLIVVGAAALGLVLFVLTTHGY